MSENKHQRPEGALIERASDLRKISARKAASLAGMSDARWRQIVSGRMSAGPGNFVPVIGPDETIARMARVVGVTPQQLRDAGRPEAADVLLTLTGMQAESDWQNVGTALERLARIREQLDGVIAELAQTVSSTSGESPRVQVVESHE